jgi:hypothetical protein
VEIKIELLEMPESFKENPHYFSQEIFGNLGVSGNLIRSISRRRTDGDFLKTQWTHQEIHVIFQKILDASIDQKIHFSPKKLLKYLLNHNFKAIQNT